MASKNTTDRYKVKDSPERSIAKAISWRFIATATTFIISFIVFDQYTEKTMNESMQNAGLIAFIEFFAKILFYYLHERMWTNITWGKYWRRTLLAKNLWKRKYRKMHHQKNLLS
jgi:uncharacterized membrane protein